MTNTAWEIWNDVHNSPDQQKRIASARKAACTPVFLDQTSCTGSFKGSSGNHTTSLSQCSCIDFNRRRLPCKHMYRLAMELDLLNCDFESDTSKIIEPGGKKDSIAETVSLVESFTTDQQKLLLEFLRHYSANNPFILAKSSDDLDHLVESSILAISDQPRMILQKYKKPELLSLAADLNIEVDKKLLKSAMIDSICNSAGDRLLKSKLLYTVVTFPSNVKYVKLHQYLHRKFDTDFFFNGSEYVEVPLLEGELPADDVTDLLKQYGYYHD